MFQAALRLLRTVTLISRCQHAGQVGPPNAALERSRHCLLGQCRWPKKMSWCFCCYCSVQACWTLSSCLTVHKVNCRNVNQMNPDPILYSASNSFAISLLNPSECTVFHSIYSHSFMKWVRHQLGNCQPSVKIGSDINLAAASQAQSLARCYSEPT